MSRRILSDAPAKLGESLKSLISAPFARPNPIAAPVGIIDVYSQIIRESRARKYGELPGIALSAATTFTLNSPTALPILHHVVKEQTYLKTPEAAELIREVGLKCISFNGIPRTINCLHGLREYGEREGWWQTLEKKPTRGLTPENVESVNERGRALWQSIYTPLDEKLYTILGKSHPDLPVYINGAHYGPLLSDPAERGKLATVGRCLTSVVAVACLRAQGGVGPQVLSHVYGLLKAVQQGAHQDELEEVDAKGVERLATDEGCEWLLDSVDMISQFMGRNFAHPIEGRIVIQQENPEDVDPQHIPSKL
ncbi:hypothetical protein QBC37DRAFT_307878 [Rhypophila decipiens]|uniref:Dol-P-Man:Man(5)GlcNAc(2)-PP-Dol alpha-1,3-mannosyltransferase n=1 Tax=Rhypophila decipiens TaxID=261697 RepID=A0AAN6YF34_9PEZI|nr:hypothetical protein QBC37DRAFT_307878 [Rhypophila decipiens]